MSLLTYSHSSAFDIHIFSNMSYLFIWLVCSKYNFQWETEEFSVSMRNFETFRKIIVQPGWIEEINEVKTFLIGRSLGLIHFNPATYIFVNYLKVASSRLSWLVAHLRIFRMFMKEKSCVYVLWPLAKIFQYWIVNWSTARNFTVSEKIRRWYFGPIVPNGEQS